MIRFAYSSIPVGFTAISMSFLSFLSQKTYPRAFLRPHVILSRIYLRKCIFGWVLPLSSFLSFFKNAIKFEPLRVREQYFQDFHISMIPTTGKSFKKIHEVRVTCPGWFNIEFPNEAFSPLSNRCYVHCKNVFYTFS